MLSAAQYVAIAAAFFLPWTIGAMKNAVTSKNRKSIIVASLLCSLDVFILVVCVLFAFMLKK